MQIMKAREGKTVYFDATNTTNRIIQVLEEETREIILLDELDKLPRECGNCTWCMQLLHGRSFTRKWDGPSELR